MCLLLLLLELVLSFLEICLQSVYLHIVNVNSSNIPGTIYLVLFHFTIATDDSNLLLNSLSRYSASD